MSFYETSNANIIRFAVHNPAKKVIAPFVQLKRIAGISSIGSGTGAHYTGTRTAGGNVALVNNSWLLTPEQIQNGSLIINPTGAGGNATCDAYTLPPAFALQEFLSGRGAFNMESQNTGANDYFVLNVYNLASHTGYIYAYQGGSAVKPIRAAFNGDDARLTPVLIEFTGVNSSYPTVNNVSNYVSYNIY